MRRNIKVKLGSLISHHRLLKRMTVGNPLSTNARIRISLSQKGISEESLTFLPPTQIPSASPPNTSLRGNSSTRPQPPREPPRERGASARGAKPIARWHKGRGGGDSCGWSPEGGPGKGLCFALRCPSPPWLPRGWRDAAALELRLHRRSCVSLLTTRAPCRMRASLKFHLINK